MFTDAAVILYWEEWKQMWEQFHAMALATKATSQDATEDATATA